MTPTSYLSREDISERVRELGLEISRDYASEQLVIVCVLKGAFVFTADLVRELDVPHRVEFVRVSSYGDETQSSGNCELLLDVSEDIEGENILIVEDIIDTGLTMTFLKNLFATRNPKSIKVATLLHKPSRTLHPVDIDYRAFEVQDRFVVGYGLDYAGAFRGLPYVGVMDHA